VKALLDLKMGSIDLQLGTPGFSRGFVVNLGSVQMKGKMLYGWSYFF